MPAQDQNLIIRMKIFSAFVVFLVVISASAQTTTAKKNTEYTIQRKNLVLKDSLQSFNSSIRLSATEKAINLRLIALRNQMLAYYDSIHFFPPSRSFYKSRDYIFTTPLFNILKQMPKGGILHSHPAAGVSYRWVIEQAMKEPGCHVYWQKDNQQFLKGQIHFYKPGEAPLGFYPIQLLDDSISNFANELYELLTFDENLEKDSVDIWREFEKRFVRIGGFVSYKPVYEKYLVSMFDTLVADGIQHVELREHLGSRIYDMEHSKGFIGPDSMIYYFQRAVKKVQSKEPAFSAVLIYTNVRFQPVHVIRNDFIEAFALRKRYPSIVKGYDLVAHEDAGNRTDYYRQVWLMRDSLSKAYSVDMPLYFHNGESSWQHVQNLYDAVLLKSPRIGHGFNLSFFPSVEEQVRKQNICIEVCPLSNQILGYIEDLRMHPAHSWIRHGIPISISPDDQGLFGYTGVTPDFWSIFLAWELDLRDLKKLCINSIQYSSLAKEEKDKALAVWEKKWKQFTENFR